MMMNACLNLEPEKYKIVQLDTIISNINVNIEISN